MSPISLKPIAPSVSGGSSSSHSTSAISTIVSLGSDGETEIRLRRQVKSLQESIDDNEQSIRELQDEIIRIQKAHRKETNRLGAEVEHWKAMANKNSKTNERSDSRGGINVETLTVKITERDVQISSLKLRESELVSSLKKLQRENEEQAKEFELWKREHTVVNHVVNFTIQQSL